MNNQNENSNNNISGTNPNVQNIPSNANNQFINPQFVQSNGIQSFPNSQEIFQTQSTINNVNSTYSQQSQNTNNSYMDSQTTNNMNSSFVQNNQVSNFPDNQGSFQFQSSNYNANLIYSQSSQPTNNPHIAEQPVINENTQLNNHKPQSNKKMIYIALGIVALVIVAIVAFSMFGSKTLVCTNTKVSAGMEMEMKATMKFKNNNITKMEALMTVGLGNYSNSKEYLIDLFEATFSIYKDKNVDVKITSDEKNIYINLTADENNFKNMEILTKSTLKEAKEELEADGFICK